MWSTRWMQHSSRVWWKNTKMQCLKVTNRRRIRRFNSILKCSQSWTSSLICSTPNHRRTSIQGSICLQRRGRDQNTGSYPRWRPRRTAVSMHLFKRSAARCDSAKNLSIPQNAIKSLSIAKFLQYKLKSLLCLPSSVRWFQYVSSILCGKSLLCLLK